MTATDIIKDRETSLEIRRGVARYALRFSPEHRTEAGACLGIVPGEEIGSVVSGAGCVVLKLGPDEWMLVEQTADDAAPIAETARRLDAVVWPHSVVDVGSRDAGIALGGASAALVLACGCPHDLGAMKPMSCARTIFDGVQVVIVKFSDQLFWLEAGQSFLAHVVSIIETERRWVASGV